ncbi:MAG TPA: hypothetical protein VF789_31965 [Thermoanaerobaculia bacterium]
MEHNWHAEITNDPDDDFSLYIELLEDDKHKGRIFRTPEGLLVLKIYDAPTGIAIPADWLMGIIKGAQVDLAVNNADPGEDS